MDEEWRVGLADCVQPAGGKPVSTGTVRDLLGRRVGAEVSVSAGKTGIFLYAATADAAAAAEGIAREVLAQQGLAADIRWSGGTRLAGPGCSLVTRRPLSCRQGSSTVPCAGACARSAQ